MGFGVWSLRHLGLNASLRSLEGPRRAAGGCLSLTHTRTHTHTLSLSLSLSTYEGCQLYLEGRGREGQQGAASFFQRVDGQRLLFGIVKSLSLDVKSISLDVKSVVKSLSLDVRSTFAYVKSVVKSLSPGVKFDFRGCKVTFSRPEVNLAFRVT